MIWHKQQGLVCIVQGGARGIAGAVSERFIRTGSNILIVSGPSSSGEAISKEQVEIRRIDCRA